VTHYRQRQWRRWHVSQVRSAPDPNRSACTVPAISVGESLPYSHLLKRRKTESTLAVYDTWWGRWRCVDADLVDLTNEVHRQITSTECELGCSRRLDDLVSLVLQLPCVTRTTRKRSWPVFSRLPLKETTLRTKLELPSRQRFSRRLAAVRSFERACGPFSSTTLGIKPALRRGGSIVAFCGKARGCRSATWEYRRMQLSVQRHHQADSVRGPIGEDRVQSHRS